MGLLDKLLGRETRPQSRTVNQPQDGTPWYTRGDTASPAPSVGASARPQAAQEQDENTRAINRYRYLLRTAPPETIEQAHAEAFAQLTPEQRRMVLDELRQAAPEHERATMTASDPQSLARSATRAELRQPGVLERTFGRSGYGGGMGMGGLLAGSFLSTVAGVVVGSAIANAFFDDSGYSDQTGDGSDSGGNADTGDSGTDASGNDASGQDVSGQDAGDPGAQDDGNDYGNGFGDAGVDPGDIGSDVGSDFGDDFGGDLGGGDPF